MGVPVGIAYLTATTERATLGSYSGDLVNGKLLLTLSTLNPSIIEGLAFAVVSFIDDDTNVRVLGDVRYYPRPEPTVLALGYGNLESVSGVVVIEPRSYNLRWIKGQGGGATWQVYCEAESGVTVPAFTPSALADGAIGLSASAVETAGGNVAQVNWYG